MTRPPLLATWLLALAPREYREFVAGDLLEEFTRHNKSSRWYWRQVWRTLPGLIALRLRGPDPAQGFTTILLTVAWLVVGWHSVMRFVCSQVPLKTDPVGWLLNFWRLP